jgi:hypothetical protein
MFIVEPVKHSNLITDLEVITFEAFIVKDLYLFLMLGIFEDFDDDLLFDAIDLLTLQN